MSEALWKFLSEMGHPDGFPREEGPAPVETSSPLLGAPGILAKGQEAMKDRAASRDNPGERSMARTVAAFNALSGQALTEEEGWAFMVCLKQARALGGRKTVDDDYIDGAAYFALQGECAVRKALGLGETGGDEINAKPSEPLPQTQELETGDKVAFVHWRDNRWCVGTVVGSRSIKWYDGSKTEVFPLTWSRSVLKLPFVSPQSKKLVECSSEVTLFESILGDGEIVRFQRKPDSPIEGGVTVLLKDGSLNIQPVGVSEHFPFSDVARVWLNEEQTQRGAG